MTLTMSQNNFLLACQYGLILSKINEKGYLDIVKPIEELSDMYVSDLSWCGDENFIAVTSETKKLSNNKN